MGQKSSKKFGGANVGQIRKKRNAGRLSYKRLRFCFRDSYSYLYINRIDYQVDGF